MSLNSISKAFENSCPQCGKGHIYKTFFEMNEDCPCCKYRFKRDSGFFVGSWIINYGICTVLIMPIFLFLLFSDSGMGFSIIFSLVLIALLQIILIPFARKVWINTHYKMSQAK